MVCMCNQCGVTGVEVENGNAEKYADAIKTLAENDGLRAEYGKAAKERAYELCSPAKFEKNIRELIVSLS